MAKQPEQKPTPASEPVPPAQRLDMQYVDRPELPETFADATGAMQFDGQTLRIELCVTRFDPQQSSSGRRVRRYPVSRLVLTPTAAVDLVNRLQQTMAAAARRRAPADASTQNAVPGSDKKP